jgi:hypothetical protein
MSKTMVELGLSEDEFKVEIIEIGTPNYPSVPMTVSRPERTFAAKVNDVLLNSKTIINLELAMDIESITGLKAEPIIKDMLKKEAINEYINDIRYIRKSKLIKIEKANA